MTSERSATTSASVPADLAEGRHHGGRTRYRRTVRIFGNCGLGFELRRFPHVAGRRTSVGPAVASAPAPRTGARAGRSRSPGGFSALNGIERSTDSAARASAQTSSSRPGRDRHVWRRETRNRVEVPSSNAPAAVDDGDRRPDRSAQPTPPPTPAALAVRPRPTRIFPSTRDYVAGPKRMRRSTVAAATSARVCPDTRARSFINANASSTVHSACTDTIPEA